MLAPADIAALLRHPDALFPADRAEDVCAAFGADVVTRVGTAARPCVDEATGLPLGEGPQDVYRLNLPRAWTALAKLLGLSGTPESDTADLVVLGFCPTALGRLKGRKICLTARATRPDVEPSAIVLTAAAASDPREAHLVRFTDAFACDGPALRFRPEVVDARLPAPSSSQKGTPRTRRISDRKLCETVLDWLLVGLSSYPDLEALRTRHRTQRQLAEALGISESELSRRIGKDSPPSLFKGLVEIFRDPRLWTRFEEWAASLPTTAARRKAFILNLSPHQLYGLGHCAKDER